MSYSGVDFSKIIKKNQGGITLWRITKNGVQAKNYTFQLKNIYNIYDVFSLYNWIFCEMLSTHGIWTTTSSEIEKCE